MGMEASTVIWPKCMELFVAHTLNSLCQVIVYMYACMQLSHHLCMVLLYDLLLGKGVQCGGPLKRFLTSHKVELLTALKNSTKMHSKSIKSTGILYFTILNF